MFAAQGGKFPSRKIAQTSSEEEEAVSSSPARHEPELSLSVSTGFLWDQTPQASSDDHQGDKEEDEEDEEEKDMEVCWICLLLSNVL